MQHARYGTSTSARIASGCDESCFLSGPNPWRLSREKVILKDQSYPGCPLLKKKKNYDVEVNKRADRRERRGRHGVFVRHLVGVQDSLQCLCLLQSSDLVSDCRSLPSPTPGLFPATSWSGLPTGSGARCTSDVYV